VKRITLKRFHSEPRRKRDGWKAWLALILILICVAGIIYLANLPEYQIKNISIEGAIFTKESEVISITQYEISKKYLLLIPASHIWLYPKQAIERKIKSAFSSVTDVSFDVSKKTSNLAIKLTERKQEFIWCQVPMEGDTQKQCFYMDKTGFIFATSPDFEGNAFITFFGEMSNEPLGKNFLPKEQMNNLISFLENLRGLELLPASVAVVSLYDVKITLRGGAILIVALDKPLAEASKNLVIILNSPDFEKASGGIDKLEYLDLRYGTKAFWK